MSKWSDPIKDIPVTKAEKNRVYNRRYYNKNKASLIAKKILYVRMSRQQKIIDRKGKNINVSI